MAISVACSCGQQYTVEEQYAGHRLPCSACGQPLTVPQPTYSPAPATTAEVACACGQRYQVDAASAGQQTPCPACGRLLTIPSPYQQAAPAAGTRRSGVGLLAGCFLFGLLFLCAGGVGAGVYVVLLYQSDEQQAENPDKEKEKEKEKARQKPVARTDEKKRDEKKVEKQDEKTDDKKDDKKGGPTTLPPAHKLPPATGTPWKGHQAGVLRLAFTADGSIWSAAGGLKEDGKPRDASLRRWDVAKGGREADRIEFVPDGLVAAAFSPDGSLAAVAPAAGPGGERGNVELWHLGKKNKLRTLKGHTERVRCLAFSADGKQLLSGADDNALILWNVVDGSKVRQLNKHTSPPTQVVFSADGRLALSGGMDHTARLWDLETGSQRRALEGHKDIVWAVALSPDGRQAATGGGKRMLPGGLLEDGARDYDIRLWDVATGTEPKLLSGHTTPVTALAFVGTGARLLSGTEDGKVRLWVNDTGKAALDFGGHAGKVTALGEFPDGRLALSGGDDRELKLWNLPVEIAVLIRDLRGTDSKRRAAALDALGSREKSEARPAIPALFEAIGRLNAEQRGKALDALRRLAPVGKEHIGHLIRLLEQRGYPDGRSFALAELEALGEEARPAAKALLALIDNTDPAVRRAALKTLTPVLSEVRDAAITPLLARLSDTDAPTRAAAEAALPKLGDIPASRLPELRRLLGHEREAARRFALRAIAALGERGAAAVDDLAARVAREPLAELRREALAALTRIAADHQRTVAAAERALQDGDRTVSRQAAKSLAAAKEVAPLLKALEHSDDEVSKTAADGLADARFTSAHVGPLGKLLDSSRPAARQRALDALGSLGADARDAVEPLCKLLKKSTGEERLRVLGTVARLGKAGAAAGPTVAALLKQPDRAVRFEACEVLIKISAAEVKQAIPVLVAALRPATAEEADDEAATKQRERARALLVEMGEPAVLPLGVALDRTFAHRPRDPAAVTQRNGAARLAAIKALDEIGHTPGNNPVLQVLSHLMVPRNEPFREVRDAAREAHRKLQVRKKE